MILNSNDNDSMNSLRTIMLIQIRTMVFRETLSIKSFLNSFIPEQVLALLVLHHSAVEHQVERSGADDLDR